MGGGGRQRPAACPGTRGSRPHPASAPGPKVRPCPPPAAPAFVSPTQPLLLPITGTHSHAHTHTHTPLTHLHTRLLHIHTPVIHLHTYTLALTPFCTLTFLHICSLTHSHLCHTLAHLHSCTHPLHSNTHSLAHLLLHTHTLPPRLPGPAQPPDARGHCWLQSSWAGGSEWRQTSHPREPARGAHPRTKQNRMGCQQGAMGISPWGRTWLPIGAAMGGEGGRDPCPAVLRGGSGIPCTPFSLYPALPLSLLCSLDHVESLSVVIEGPGAPPIPGPIPAVAPAFRFLP